ERERPARDARAERFALEQLHREEQLALLLDHLVELADIGVVHGRRRARLAPQALAGRRIVRAGADALDRDLTLQALVVGREDDAHAALTQLAGEAVVRDALQDGG